MRLHISSRRGFAGLIIALVVAAAGSIPNATPASADPPAAVRILTWNMCGNADHCPYKHEPEQKADALVRSITSHSASIVLLQEVCTSHLTALRQRLDTTWTIEHTLVHRRNGPIPCRRAGGYFSIAILIKGTTVTSHEWALPHPSGKEQRLALCVRTPAKLSACNTHFTSEDEDPTGAFRFMQAAFFQRLLAGERSVGYRVIGGGDLNTEPTEEFLGIRILGGLYRLAQECDESQYGELDGEKTMMLGENKIDYVFGVGFDSLVGDAVDSAYSDHRLLKAWFQNRP